jgi:hypothetical protein
MEYTAEITDNLGRVVKFYEVTYRHLLGVCLRRMLFRTMSGRPATEEELHTAAGMLAKGPVFEEHITVPYEWPGFPRFGLKADGNRTWEFRRVPVNNMTHLTVCYLWDTGKVTVPLGRAPSLTYYFSKYDYAKV